MYNTYIVYRISIASVHTYIIYIRIIIYVRVFHAQQTQTYYTNRSPTAAASKNRNLLQVEKLKV